MLKSEAIGLSKVFEAEASEILSRLEDHFGESIPGLCPIAAEELPSAARQLLDHDAHMTVTLEAYYSEPVVVRPYRIVARESSYGRKLDLLGERSGRLVLTGMMRIAWHGIDPEVRLRIEEQQSPLGRILIEHGVLRQVSLAGLLRVAAHCPLARRFWEHEEDRKAQVSHCFGRLARILCDGKPSIDLLEIVSPY